MKKCVILVLSLIFLVATPIGEAGKKLSDKQRLTVLEKRINNQHRRIAELEAVVDSLVEIANWEALCMTQAFDVTFHDNFYHQPNPALPPQYAALIDPACLDLPPEEPDVRHGEDATKGVKVAR